MTAPSSTARIAGLGCMVLFMLPFAAVGVFTMAQGVRHAAGGEWGIWLAAVWATVHFGAPMLLQVIFGVFGLLILWGTVASWLGVSQVTVGDGAVTVASGLLAPMRERRLATDEIAEVTTKIGMQAGNTPYYDLILVRKDGKQMSAGRGIRDKREAEWLAATMREALRD